jgi:hypothetical protein
MSNPVLALTLLTVALVGCGGGGGSGAPTTFSIGATVSGLSGARLVLSQGIGANTTVGANGPITLSMGLANGATYGVLDAGGSGPGNVGTNSGVTVSAVSTSSFCGCTTWSVEPTVVGLELHDRPVGYAPTFGPAVQFDFYHSQRDVRLARQRTSQVIDFRAETG